MPIDMSTCNAIQPNDWAGYRLVMTEEGLDYFKSQIENAASNPVVYSHVESASGRVLRIGISSGGIRSRWLTDFGNHLATFEWSMGISDRYSLRKATEHRNYVLFYRQLAELHTTVWTAECDVQSLVAIESTLRKAFNPVWEQFKKLWNREKKNRGDALFSTIDNRSFDDPQLPRIDNIQSARCWPLALRE